MIDVAALYRKHGAMVFRRARWVLDDEEAARDVVHDVFITLHERQHELRDTAMISWLYVVATNFCLKRLRAAATRARLDRSIGCAPHASARGENIAAIRSLLAALPEQLSAVAIYRFVDEMTHSMNSG